MSIKNVIIYSYYLIFYINIIKKNILINSYLIFPLEYLNNENYRFISDNFTDSKNSEIMQRIYFNTLITQIKIGTPSRNISLFIDINTDNFYLKSIISSNKNKNKVFESNYYIFMKNNFYNELLSLSYKEEFCKLINSYSGICLCKENFIFNIKNVKVEKEFPIKIIKNIGDDIPGFLGLFYDEIYHNKTKSFINLLKEQNIIDNYYWFFEIDKFSTSEIKGNLIIGELPHNVFPKKYSKEDLRFTKAIIISNLYKSWRIKLNNIYIETARGNYNLHDEIIALNNRIYNIIGTIGFNNLIKELFMNQLLKEKKCFYSNFIQNTVSNNEINFYYCLKSVKDILYENLNSVKFFLSDFDFIFELTKDELFYIKDEYIYLMILFRNNKLNHWTMGQMFIYKYNFIFDTDNKLIGFYKKYNNISINNNLSNNINYEKNKIILVIIIIVSLVFFFIGLIIGRKIFRLRKKIIVNELIDKRDDENGFNYKEIENKNEIIEMKNKFKE